MSSLIGTFPKRLDTIKAEVLAKLIEGNELSGMDAVRNISTTRLASPIHTLRRTNEWQIQSRDSTVHTSDGRTEQVSIYSLPDEIKTAAIAAGGEGFCARVKEARAKLRDGRK